MKPVRDLVARVRHGQVLVVAGALPELLVDTDGDDGVFDDAHELVGATHHIAPPVRLEDPDPGSRLHVVTSGEQDTGELPSGEWVPYGTLSPLLAAAVATAADAYLGAAPRLRPEWFSMGWFERACAWIDEVSAAHGYQRTGRVRTYKFWALSAVLRVPTDRGDLWFKASCEYFCHEAAAVSIISSHDPDVVPGVVAVESDRGWLLMRPMSGASDASRVAGSGAALAPRWAAVQLHSRHYLADLQAAGIPVRGETETLDAWRILLADRDVWRGLSEQTYRTLVGFGPRLDALVAEFWACGLPDVLAHGDLHPGNVAFDGREVRVFDLSDACVTHPLLDGSHLAYFESNGLGSADVLDAFAAPWRAAFPHAAIDRAIELASLVDRLFQAVTYAGLAEHTETDGEFDSVMPFLAERIIEWMRTSDTARP